MPLSIVWVMVARYVKDLYRNRGGADADDKVER
jgi:hypothetical protein